MVTFQFYFDASELIYFATIEACEQKRKFCAIGFRDCKLVRYI